MSYLNKLAEDFTLPDAQNKPHNLYKTLEKGPVMLVFYPGDFTPVCTKQLCDYQEHWNEFLSAGVQVFGISKDSPEKHADFSAKYGFKFPLLSDPKNEVAKNLGCTSGWMLGMVSRAIVIINRNKKIVYHHVEPVAITRRRSGEIFDSLKTLRAENQI